MDPIIIKKSNESVSDNSVRLNKVDILILNNGWNDKNEKLIVSIGYSSNIYKNLHEKTAIRYNFYDKLINLPLLMLSVFLSTNAIAEFLDTNYIIIRRLTVFIVTVFSVLNTFLKYAELSTKHSYAAGTFNNVYNDIRNTMCIYRKDRQNAVKYIQTIMKEYDHLEVSSPEIPKSFIKKMRKKTTTQKEYLNENVVMPTDEFQEIQIIVEKDSDKFKINNTQNLKEIHDCFKIDGELCENDNITFDDIHQSRIKGLNLQTEYQMNRLNSNF